MQGPGCQRNSSPFNGGGWEGISFLGVKDQVIAQYGPDSDQVAALGLKKKSNRKAPTRAGKPAA